MNGILMFLIAKLMRQAADILSSAPAMQIRQLEAYQAMAKSANSKVIFIPTTHSNLGAGAGFGQTTGGATAGPSGSSPHPQGNDEINFESIMTQHMASEL